MTHCEQYRLSRNKTFSFSVYSCKAKIDKVFALINHLFNLSRQMYLTNIINCERFNHVKNQVLASIAGKMWSIVNVILLNNNYCDLTTISLHWMHGTRMYSWMVLAGNAAAAIRKYTISGWSPKCK